jgi:hypothetical protein
MTMSTRAIYSFVDPENHEIFHVYKHFDGYPEGAKLALEAALAKAWDLPRFEADEFGAAFVAANKMDGGNLRLLHSGAWQDVAPGDIEYRYEISLGARGKLNVKSWSVFQDNSGAWTEKPSVHFSISNRSNVNA